MAFRTSLAGVVLLAAVSLPAQTTGFRSEPVARGLELACAMAFVPDGRLLVCERLTGRVRVVEHGAVTGTWATLPVVGQVNNSQGLLGIAVDPDFERNGHVYVFCTRTTATTHNVVVRLTEVGGVGTQPTVISPEIPSVRQHSSGAMTFGLDGKLYVVTGDRDVPALAQQLDNLHGKVLRFDVPDGTVPADNPFPGSPIWSYGHRNVFGIAAHPSNGDVYVTENGLVTMDEANRIVRGGNYGWPLYEGLEPIPDPATVDPLTVWGVPTPDPTGTAFYTGTRYPAAFAGGWFVCKYSDGDLVWVDLDANGSTVHGEQIVYDYAETLFGVANAPDGTLWTLHSSGNARGADSVDRIVHEPETRPALALTAVSARAVGAAVTVGWTATAGETASAWLGAARLPAAVPTPFGDLWVPLQVPLPTVPVVSDDRAYLALPVPNDPTLVGSTVHAQGATWSATGGALTPPVELTLR